MSRGPPLGTLAWTSSRPEHSCRLPTPGRPPTSGTVPGRFSKASSGDIALLHGRGKAAPCQRRSRGGGFSGDFSLHPSASPASRFPLVPPYPGNRRGPKGVRERWTAPAALPGPHSSLPLRPDSAPLHPDLWVPVWVCAA